MKIEESAKKCLDRIVQLYVYERQHKLVGIAFGGTMGNERVFVDEDFASVSIRHHATDKTYQPDSLFPDQGFLPVEALISEIEVWGLGGKAAKEVQSSYKKREELFTEQRRKVDLKTFGSWDDSPEKI
uniref:TLDc domain-containing protein n=1 Tax=Quercus lobata TaxID=97700 RepID=A0A7N2L5B9_QUELO